MGGSKEAGLTSNCRAWPLFLPLLGLCCAFALDFGSERPIYKASSYKPRKTLFTSPIQPPLYLNLGGISKPVKTSFTSNIDSKWALSHADTSSPSVRESAKQICVFDATAHLYLFWHHVQYHPLLVADRHMAS